MTETALGSGCGTGTAPGFIPGQVRTGHARAEQVGATHARAEQMRAAHDELYRDGVVGLRGAFDRDWVVQLARDVEVAFAQARERPRGTVGRGPNRHYVEIHPQQLRGFLGLVDHPWITALSQAVIGADYEIVEIGFDVPLPGAVDQPWHRDFPMPPETRAERRLTSLAFNVTTVDTTPDMGPFEIAPGTQWDDDADFDHQMFPPRLAYLRYEQLAVRKLPRMGDISARSALAIHRGTANHSRLARPVLVLGVDHAGSDSAERHDMAVSADFWAGLPQRVREHLHCQVVEKLHPVTQKHTIEGLIMGAS